jgi:hypothetical protein
MVFTISIGNNFAGACVDALCGVLWLFLGWTALGGDSGVGVRT